MPNWAVGIPECQGLQKEQSSSCYCVSWENMPWWVVEAGLKIMIRSLTWLLSSSYDENLSEVLNLSKTLGTGTSSVWKYHRLSVGVMRTSISSALFVSVALGLRTKSGTQKMLIKWGFSCTCLAHLVFLDGDLPRNCLIDPHWVW